MTLCCFHCGKTINLNFSQSSLFHGNVQTTTKYSRRSVFCFKAKHCLTKKSKAKRKKKKAGVKKKKMIIQRKNVYKSNACSSIEKEETIVCFQMLRTGK